MLPQELKDEILMYLDFETLSSLGDFFLYIQKRKYVLQEENIDDVVWDGKFNTLKWILKHTSQNITKNTLKFSAERGHLEMLKWVHYNYPHAICTESAMDRAIVNGHLEVVRWLHENRTEGCSPNAMDFAAERGNLEMLKFLNEYRPDCYTDLFLIGPIERDHLDIIKWVCQNSEFDLQKIFNAAVSRRAIKIIHWMHDTYNLTFSSFNDREYNWLVENDLSNIVV